MTRTALAIVAALALGAAGCGGGGSTSTTSSAPATTPAQTGSSGASGGTSASGGAVAIKMQNIQFAPKDQTVKVGQRVTWTNDDTVAHNVTATNGASFKSSDFGQGASYSFTPKKAGTITYTCTLHPGMNGTLTVEG